jgi:hypothetical protein
MKGEKTGGRNKGTPNKVTADLRANIQAFLDANFETIIQAFETLDNRDKLNYFVKLLEYAIPKQRQIEDTTISQLFAMTPEQRAERIKEIEGTINQKK